MRTYGTNPQIWDGDPACEHSWQMEQRKGTSEGGSDKQKSNKGANNVEWEMGFCSKCDAWLGELGSEPTVALFIKHMTMIFHEVKRVLHPSGVCWVDIGDTYFGGGRGPTGKNGIGDQAKRQGFDTSIVGGRPVVHRSLKADGDGTLKPKDLCLVPQRLAIAMQEDGWWIRSQVVWQKLVPMPESMHDRPAMSWEPIWMVTKEPVYYFDMEAAREPAVGAGVEQKPKKRRIVARREVIDETVIAQTRNPRNVWPMTTEAFDGEYCTACHELFFRKSKKRVVTKVINEREERLCPSCGGYGDVWLGHYASFPPELPRRAIVAGSSERGVCPTCFAPWKRILEVSDELKAAREQRKKNAELLPDADDLRVGNRFGDTLVSVDRTLKTIGWEPTCGCAAHTPVPSVVLDPFSGSGTTGATAIRLGRRYIGIELLENYADMSRQRIASDSPLMAAMVGSGSVLK